jgi:hypothetical protein
MGEFAGKRYCGNKCANAVNYGRPKMVENKKVD